MAEVKKYENFRDFGNSCLELVNENPLLNHYLWEKIQMILQRCKLPIKYFTIEDGTKKIACIHDDDCLIYGKGFTTEMLALLANELELGRINTYTFAGNKEIIDAVFEPFNFTSEVLKHRIIYKCDKVNENVIYASGQLKMAQPYQTIELAEHGLKFLREYYGANVKTLEEMQPDTFASIIKGYMYIWTDNGRICSMVQTMLDGEEFPVIGYFYTPDEFRGNGYGTSILHAVTQGSLRVNEYLMLVADAQNPASNKVFIKVGYKPVGEYICVFKTKAY